jgi:hypothetical protein
MSSISCCSVFKNFLKVFTTFKLDKLFVYKLDSLVKRVCYYQLRRLPINMLVVLRVKDDDYPVSCSDF